MTRQMIAHNPPSDQPVPPLPSPPASAPLRLSATTSLSETDDRMLKAPGVREPSTFEVECEAKRHADAVCDAHATTPPLRSCRTTDR